VNPEFVEVYNNKANALSTLAEIEARRGNTDRARQLFTEAFENFEKYLKTVKRNFHEVVRVYPDYIYLYINSERFKLSEFYEKLCEFFQYFQAAGGNEEKLSEIATKIATTGIEPDENPDFGNNQRCVRFYREVFYPLYLMAKTMTKVLLHSKPDREDEV
jgi:hypothetical protein